MRDIVTILCDQYFSVLMLRYVEWITSVIYRWVYWAHISEDNRDNSLKFIKWPVTIVTVRFLFVILVVSETNSLVYQTHPGNQFTHHSTSSVVGTPVTIGGRRKFKIVRFQKSIELERKTGEWWFEKNQVLTQWSRAIAAGKVKDRSNISLYHKLVKRKTINFLGGLPDSSNLTDRSSYYGNGINW
jgi:hypothetical protein